MRNRPFREMVLAALCACTLIPSTASPAFLQSQSQEKYRLAAVKFDGLIRFTNEQASEAIALHPGDPVDPARLAAAADVLAKSGAFDDVNYRYSSDKGTITAEFRLVETQKMLPCFFDNFVWFSDEQLDRTLRKRVPFYAGGVPESGETVKQVIAALREMLRANGIAGDVEEIPSAVIGKGVMGFRFRVTGIAMPIRSAAFPGASAVSEKDLVGASTEVIDQDFSLNLVTTFASAGLLPIYRRRGYLRARFEHPQGRIIGAPTDLSHPEIALVLPVVEGQEFRWEKAEWAGNHEFSSEDLDRVLGMKPREVANQEKIEAGLAAVKKAYSHRGFVDASVEPQVILEDASQLASWDITIHEGIQYRMGQLHVDSLNERVAKKLAAGFALKSGDVYDGNYLPDFIQKVAAPELLKNGVANMRSSMKIERDKQKAIIDLYLIFH
jgi:outer membrane protein assembly factor BamA